MAPGHAIARWKRTPRRPRSASAARDFWQSPLPIALLAVGAFAAVTWWRKKKEAESLATIANP